MSFLATERTPQGTQQGSRPVVHLSPRHHPNPLCRLPLKHGLDCGIFSSKWRPYTPPPGGGGSSQQAGSEPAISLRTRFELYEWARSPFDFPSFVYAIFLSCAVCQERTPMERHVKSQEGGRGGEGDTPSPIVPQRPGSGVAPLDRLTALRQQVAYGPTDRSRHQGREGGRGGGGPTAPPMKGHTRTMIATTKPLSSNKWKWETIFVPPHFVLHSLLPTGLSTQG